ncbi:MAG: PIN domain-containing protein [Phycisphaerales bacterium]|nr:PIN domain-containing protein [Phycisphaerales bacterium]
MGQADLARVFVDTHALIALVNSDDSKHEAASLLFERLVHDDCEFVLSEWVLAEFLTVCSRRRLRSAGLRLVSTVLSDVAEIIYPADHATFEASFALFRQRSDKEWSLIDCTSIVLCRQRRITAVFTGDKHFSQAGLNILL